MTIRCRSPSIRDEFKDALQRCAGDIGFEIQESFRGHGYALQACRAIAPAVRLVDESVTVTCDPDNFASIRTTERLGGQFVEPPRES
jgi:predicted acetyltransferase